jgi:hypothetical protein
MLLALVAEVNIVDEHMRLLGQYQTKKNHRDFDWEHEGRQFSKG